MPDAAPAVPPAVGFGWTARGDGDFSGLGDLPPWGAAPRPWTLLRQVHGAEVVVVRAPGEHTGAPADAAVTTAPGCTLAVRTADCVPIVLAGPGVVAVVHAGWRGLRAGVVERTAESMAEVAAPPSAAVLGPCIRAGCYEFDDPAREVVAARFGDEVLATTCWGTPALDLPAAARSACRAAGVADVTDDAGCTACDARWFSHRARAEPQRFATVAWLRAEAAA